MEKIKLKVTQRQKEWLDKYKTDEDVTYAIDIQPLRKRPDSPIVDWTSAKVARALLIGYEAEETFKVGDWVVWETEYETLTLKIEKIKVRETGMKVFSTDEFSMEYIKRHATPEEIKAEKERRVWKSIGREVREFRVGDAYENLNGLTHTIDRIERILVVEGLYEKGKLKGFYPVESSVSFGGGEE